MCVECKELGKIHRVFTVLVTLGSIGGVSSRGVRLLVFVIYCLPLFSSLKICLFIFQYRASLFIHSPSKSKDKLNTQILDF